MLSFFCGLSIRRRLAPAGLALSLLAGCASQAPFVPQPLDPQQRRLAYEQVVRSVAEDYVDAHHNGVDWAAVSAQHRERVLAAPDDAGFWRELDRMVGELHDAHTRVRSPLDLYARPTQRGSHGLALEQIDGRLVVGRVAEDSQAQLLGVKPGQQLLRIEGAPAPAWLQQHLDAQRGSSTERAAFLTLNRTLNAAPVDSLLPLELQRADGSVLALTLRQDPTPVRGLRSHWLASGQGYLQFSHFDDALRADLERSLKRLSGTPGLVLDLRGNLGGSLRLTLQLLGWFLPPGKVGEVYTRDNRRLSVLLGLLDITPKLEIEPQDGRLSMPLAVLIDERSASAAELMSAVLQDRGRARIFGSTSCGCLLSVRGTGTELAGGGRLILSEIDMRIGQSRRVEGVGVQPDEAIRPSVAALQAGADPVLQAALAWLESQRPTR